MNDGYEYADEASFAATTITPDFLGSLSDKDEKMDAYQGRIFRNRRSKRNRARKKMNE